MCGIKEFESEFANKCEGNFFLEGRFREDYGSVLSMSIRMIESGLVAQAWNPSIGM